HPHGAADGARDVDPELEALQTRVRGTCRNRRQPGPSAASDLGSVHLDLAQLLVQLHHEPVDARIRYQEVRPRADDPYLEPLGVGPREQVLQVLDRAGTREQLGRATGPDRREPRERVVALDPGGRTGHREETRWAS